MNRLTLIEKQQEMRARQPRRTHKHKPLTTRERRQRYEDNKRLRRANDPTFDALCKARERAKYRRKRARRDPLRQSEALKAVSR